MTPTKLEIKDKKLQIVWDDNSTSEISLKRLRINCPCAYCSKEREEQSKSYIPLFSEEQLKITEIKPVGSYALGIKWEDGHNTGIFEFNQLKQLSN